jgi:hypothetical protein
MALRANNVVSSGGWHCGWGGKFGGKFGAR